MLCSVDANPLKITNIEKYRIIDALRMDYPIERICNVLNITSRAYRKWVRKGKPLINNQSEDVLDIIQTEHENSYAVYGTIRLKKHIERKYGIIYNHKRVRRIKNSSI